MRARLTGCLLLIACLLLAGTSLDAPGAFAQQVIIEGQVKKQGQQSEKLPAFNKADLKPKPPAKNPGNKLLEEVIYFYKIDEETRYVDLKNQYQNRHRGEMPIKEAEKIALQAFLKANVEKRLDKWLYHGGASPNVFLAKVHLFNQNKSALLNTKLEITLRAKEGEWLVNPAIQMTDFQHLLSTAKWRTLWQHTEVVPVVAPGEDMLVPALGRFNVLKYMRINPNRWPLELELTVRAPALGEQVSARLEMVPDHFLVPLLY